MRTMYDAVNASNIPTTPPPSLVAGYVDQIVIPPWTVNDWNRFPSSTHVGIVKKSSSVFGNVLDVERGDATNAQVVGWLTNMRMKGYVPAVYTSYGNWSSLQAIINNAGIPHPEYWIADYSQNPNTWWPKLNGIDAIAWQYTDHSNLYDMSLVKDFWPGVDDGMTPEQAQQLQALYDAFWTTTNTAYKETVYDSLKELQDGLTALAADVAAMKAGQVANGPYYLTTEAPQ